jgi:hypothetical protein
MGYSPYLLTGQGVAALKKNFGKSGFGKGGVSILCAQILKILVQINTGRQSGRWGEKETRMPPPVWLAWAWPRTGKLQISRPRRPAFVARAGVPVRAGLPALLTVPLAGAGREFTQLLE